MAKTKTRGRTRRSIEIMDTTLRDGEQAEGVSMMPEEKLVIARKLLCGVGVDRIEITSARVSEGELGSLKEIMAWARKEKLVDRVEILGFTDIAASVDWALEGGCRVINLLTKGSLQHCREQLQWEAIGFVRDRHRLHRDRRRTPRCCRNLWRYTGRICDRGIRRIRL